VVAPTATRALTLWACFALWLLSACVERAPKQPSRVEREKDSAISTQPAPLKPQAPPVRLFASRLVAKVRQAASREAQRIGYLRGGAVVQATGAEPVGYEKCKKGWYGLDTGGFVCSTIDAIPFATQRLPERQPLQPDLSAALPYPYGYSLRHDTPMFRRLPTDEESARFEAYRAPSGPPLNLGPPPAPTEAGSGLNGAPDPSPLPALPLVGNPHDESEAQDGVATLASLQGEEGSVLMRRMQRGFYVSLDREMQKNERSYWRTQSNGFIPSKGLRLVTGSDFQGVALRERGLSLPIGYVMSKKDVAYKLTARGYIQGAGHPGYHHMLRIVSEAEVRGARFLVDDTGLHYRIKNVTRIDPREKPAEVGADEKWIDIDLAIQSLVAYVGAEPVYATLISSGRIRDPLDPLKNFETPSGAFRVKSKHLTATMDGDHAIDGPYSIEDVPYVMYFQLAYALHSAFWHDSFGRPHSHGCINLAPLDAKWLFEFAEPALPKAWHGVYPTPQQLGTRLYIHGITPQG
jgi:hypothetical protein